MEDLYGFTPSNTLASANFDVLKVSGIEDPLINVNKLATLDFEESYFSRAIAFINESRNEYTNAKSILYGAISEATSERVVLESFSDFFVKVKEIIDKFLKFIKSLFSRFLTTLNKIIGSEKYLEKHKKDFDNFKEADEFDFEGYEYTFNQNIPLPQAALQFNNSLFDKLWADKNGALTTNGVKEAIAAMDLEEDYAKFRADVIGKSGEKIYVTDYAIELFKLYRNNYDTTSKIDVDRSYIRAAKDRFFSYNSTKKYVNNQYKQIEDSYKKVESQVQDIVRRNGDLNAKAFLNRLPSDNGITAIDGNNELDGLTMSGELMTQLDIYVKAKVDQIQEYSNIHTLAFAAKLDAMKECYKQDKNTLYTALSRIQRTDAKRKD